MLIICGKCGSRFTSVAAFFAHGSCVPNAPKPKPPKMKNIKEKDE